ncbi:3-oxoadipate enol-lactonase [Neomegalonema sp.]|uniref:3-oxoadipate enol-lactonase n=1 Tax=Neomegalonema sp. TaxID=2039713 RepID=UPI002606F5BF|nr:3-oxoadipate enol-lactonase [Neomegalonema sp.]MDD2867858.1 3-oxoadipate enol-lactonase [Neomegalonema sp.]
MQVLMRPWGALHYRVDGPEEAPAVVFANSLGTDLRLWDAVLPLLPRHRAIRFDKRGHGLSDRSGPHGVADLAEDAAALIEAEAKGPVLFVGLSLGGCVGQSLALTRPDLVRALVLSNTAAKMGTPESWRARVEAIRKGGLESIADPVMERWFAPAFRASAALALWRNMLTRTDPEGYAAACGALADFDLTARLPALRPPTLVIAGSEDGASPPDLVEATARLVPGAVFRIIPGAGHLPCVETPEAWASILAPFLTEHAR